MTGTSVRWRKNQRPVLVAGLPFSESEQQFGALVPRQYSAIRVDNENRVVTSTFDQEPETLLAFPECGLPLLSCGDIRERGHRRNDLVVGVPNRR